MRTLLAATLATLVGALAASAQTVQYRSRDGIEHRSLADSGAIARAEREVAADPRNVEKLLALGLAQAAVRQYREAVATFTRGIAIAPTNPLLYRWRGHRYISLGDFDRALADLTRGNGLDTLNYDIWYHLGVAHFERVDFAKSADAFAHAQRLAPNADELAGSSDWLWMAASRAGRSAQAQQALSAISDSLKITTATAYAQRLKLYRGVIGPDQVVTPADTAGVQRTTLSYGVGNWFLVRGDTVNARRWFQRAVEARGWPAFAYFAAEGELRRLSTSEDEKTRRREDEKTDTAADEKTNTTEDEKTRRREDENRRSTSEPRHECDTSPSDRRCEGSVTRSTTASAISGDCS